MRKTIILSILVAVLAVPMVLANGQKESSKSATSGPSMVLRLATISPVDSPPQKGAELFKQLVEKGTDGRITVNIHPNSQLGSAPQYTQQIKLGTLALGLVTSGQMQEYIKQYAIVETPFLFADLKQAHTALDGSAGQLLAKLAEKQGFVILANWEWGFREITNSVRPITKPADLKGLKMRVPNEFQLRDMMQALGASTDTIAFPELYTALAQKVVDGQDNPVQTIYDHKFYEVQKYMAMTNHAYNTQMLVMAQNWWNKLSRADQKLLRSVAHKAGLLVRKLDASSEQKEIQLMEQHGMTVTHPNLAAFRKAAEPAVQKVIDYVGNPFAEQFIKDVQAAGQ